MCFILKSEYTLKCLYGCLSVSTWVFFLRQSIFRPQERIILGKWGQFGHCYFKGLFEEGKEIPTLIQVEPYFSSSDLETTVPVCDVIAETFQHITMAV